MSEQEGSLRAPSAFLSWRVQVCRWLWRMLRWVWSTLVVAILVGVVVNLVTASTNTSFSSLYLTRLVTTYRLPVSLGFALLLLFTLLAWLGSREERALPMPSLSKQNRSHMLRRLHLLYEQILSQSLQGTVQIELGFVEQPSAVEQPLNLVSRLPSESERPLPPHTSIIDVYEQTQHELLILGEPGAGKSTLLLELAQYLVKQAEQDTKQPMPIRLPLSTWAVTRRRLDEWLGDEIARLYQVSPRLSRQWIAAEQVLPLLDGLDEMDEAARPACVAAINTYHREHALPLIICSRTSEYSVAIRHTQLELGTAVVVAPLEPKQVDAYLEREGEPLAGLRAALQTNTHLQELATTPLMLQVLMLTYHGISVRALPQQEKLLRRQIWNDYVQRMVRDKGNAKRYPLASTTHSLRWLASEMRRHNQTIFSLESLQPDWFSPTQRKQYRWSVGLTVWLSFTLLAGLICALLLGIFGLVGGLSAGLVSDTSTIIWSVSGLALIAGVVVGRNANIKPVERLTWSSGKKRAGLLHRLIIGLGLIVGVILWPIGWLIVGLSREQLTERLTLAPNEGIRNSLKNGLSLGLILGLGSGLIIGSLNWPSDALTNGLLVVLIVGLLVGLRFGLAAAFQHYTLRFWLARSGVFPWQAVPFLEDATARILLRRVGGGYSFAHRLLLDFFADAKTPFPMQTRIADET